jgi:hypothetical protein
MGKSAKVHKRTVRTFPLPYETLPPAYACIHSSQRKTASGASPTTPPSKPTPVAVASAANKKASTRTKGRVKRPRPSGPGESGPVLGGADYVDMLLGSRRRGREEAQKLPRDPPT